MDKQHLEKYCKIIQGIAGKEAIQQKGANPDLIRDYYKNLTFLYKKFHSAEGAMHMPISFSEEATHQSKLYYQANCIHEIIEQHQYSNILELGCGMGFNTVYLAKKNPQKNFTGVDLTPDNLKIAKSASKDLENISFYQGDYNLPTAVDNKYDLIFAVETLCYATNLIELLAHLNRQLKPHGRIVIFDGYIRSDAALLTHKYEIEAYALLCWGFALDSFQALSDFLNTEKINFMHVENIVDFSNNILPNYATFGKATKKAFRFHLALKFFHHLGFIPLAVIKQLSAGLMGFHFISEGYLGYYQIVLSKTSSKHS